ncbi:M20/M25/M40 family metallo-hydrolase [Nonomuraea rhodomycinica]|uniref:Vacuolar membrane protease n=1 Tax=Nonomuraea rhodomycinica TaxID=1712872 RepID=A0A7Y6IQM5_9ACTN|nr:M20/M25/M40 family metallo-hydrolase [Nonomuraea rhodomycinica]NUW42143.1 M20/M25/M40 family metallo-hydrolase [Nonomuraea rhodomycinica]
MIRFASFLVLAALLAATMLDLASPRPRAESPGFRATRAFKDIQAIARAPHPTGSAENERVRDHLVSQLRGLGLRTEVQEGVGVLPIAHDGTTPVGRVRNVVATRPGTASTGRIILAAHYDSAPGAPGAADDGAGVATLLEVARTLPSGLRNDVVFLFTDGEEAGLLGAEAFARRNRFEGPVVVLNHEARGTAGTVQMFRSSGALSGVYGSAAPHPAADSAFSSLMSLLPNDTDFHVFREAGWMGLDSAFIGSGVHYHSPLDDPAHLDQGSLQQMGDNALALTQALAGRDLVALHAKEESVFFTVPGGFIRYPASLELPVAVVGMVLALVLVHVLRRRGLLTWPRVTGAAGLCLAAVVLAALAGYGLWPLLGALRPEYTMLFTGEPYRPLPYRAALLALTTGIVLVWAALFSRVTSRRTTGERQVAGLAAGAVLLVALLGVLSALALPGGSHSFAWPALFAAAGWLVALLLPEAPGGLSWGSGAALTVGLAPAAIILGGAALSSLDIGLSIGGPIAATYFALLLLLMLVLQVKAPRRRTTWVLPAVAIVLVGVGLVVDRFDAAHPRQERLAYSLDTDTGEAVWGRPGDSELSVRFFGEAGFATSKAPVAPLRAPALTVLKDTTANGKRSLTLRLTPSGGAPAVGLSLPGKAVITVAGRDLGEKRGFTFHAPPAEGVEVTLLLAAGEVRIRAFQRDYDPSVVPGYRTPASAVLMRPVTTAFVTKVVDPAR